MDGGIYVKGNILRMYRKRQALTYKLSFFLIFEPEHEDTHCC